MKRGLITGCRRSGTTYAGKILALNRRVSYIEEPFNKLQGLKKFPKVWYPYIKENQEMLLELDEFMRLGNPEFSASLSNRKGHSKINVGIDDLLINVFSNFSNEPILKRLSRVLFVSHHKVSFYKTKMNPFRVGFFIKDPLAALSAEIFVQLYKTPVFAIYREPKAYYYSMARKNWSFDPNEFTLHEEVAKRYPFIERVIFENDFEDVDEWIIKEWLVVNTCLLDQRKNNGHEFYLINHNDIIESPIDFIKFVYSKVGLSERLINQNEVRKLMVTDNKSQRAKDIRRNSKVVNEIYKDKLTEMQKEVIDRKTIQLYKELENAKTTFS